MALSQVTSVVLEGGEFIITAEHDGSPLPEPLRYHATPPEDHTPDSWLKNCCREACLLVEARAEAAAPAPVVELAVPAEFTADAARLVKAAETETVYAVKEPMLDGESVKAGK